MADLAVDGVKSFHRWSVDNVEAFWQKVVETLGIHFKAPYTAVCDLSQSVESPVWFPNGKINITDSCFFAPEDHPAIYYADDNKTVCSLSYGELNKLSNRIANGLSSLGYKAGDPIAIIMPMDYFAVAIYLAIIKIGGIVVSIADSFSSEEIASRLNIAKAKGVFTQDVILRSGKKHDLYKRVHEACRLKTIVLPASGTIDCSIRSTDMEWKDFIASNSRFESVACDPMSACNILFSSGTTGTPKAIVWNHSTAIKCASDAFFHQNIQASDTICWPTNLGWMMGPWLIFAALINRASLALYTDVPASQAFGQFVQDAKVTILGVVPTLVAGWRQSHCMQDLDWSKIKLFTSTGEASNPDDMRYLSSLAEGKPIIEYCGGTEIGGAYVTSTVIETNYPSEFTTPAMGIDFTILNENGKPDNVGQAAIIPPSIGLSTRLLNADHHKEYFQDMPKDSRGNILRRHGDQIEQLTNGNYIILGRMDDTMNLGGIKVSSAEIERVLAGIPGIIETAAIAVSPPNNGPNQLVIYASASEKLKDENIKSEMQKRISQSINPLFKIHKVIFLKELPRTASNKVMRRVLRKNYLVEASKAS